MTERKLAAVVLAAMVLFGVLTGAATFGLFTDRESVPVRVAGNVPAAGNTDYNLGTPADLASDDSPSLLGSEEDAPEELPLVTEGPAISPHHAAAARQYDPPLWGGGR